MIEAAEQVIDGLCLEGHDSELFSFLDPAYIEQLTKHPAANVPLWSFGRVDEGRLRGVPMWNTSPGCYAWMGKPVVQACDDGFTNYRGMVTKDGIIQLTALTLVRYLFVQGYTCALDDRHWIAASADPGLERLPYIRGYGGKSKQSSSWPLRQADYFDWALVALELLEQRRAK